MAIIIGVLSLLFLGISTGLIAKPSKQIGGIRALLYSRFVTALVALLAFFIFFEESKFSLKYMLIAFGVGTLGYIGVAAFYKGLSAGKVGIVAPIANSSSFITIILASFIYGQKISGFQFLAIALIIIGVILISINFADFKIKSLFDKSSGIVFGFIAMFFWGVTFALLKIPVDELGPFLTTLIIEITNIIFAFVTLSLQPKENRNGKSSKMIMAALIVASALNAIGFLLYNVGIEKYNMNIIAALAFANPLVAAIFGGLVYNERLSVKEYIGILFTVIGIIIISAL